MDSAIPMFRTLFYQFCAMIIAALIAGVWSGVRGGVSAALGGGVCLLPNLLFVLRLKSLARRPGASYPVHFFLGEFIKIAATIGLMMIVVKVYADLHWPSMLIGLGLALQAGLLAFWKKT